MNTVTLRVAQEVASHEGIVRQAYKDSVGVWTWSVGLTSATGHKVDRYIGNPKTLEHCLRIYVWALQNYARAVDKTFAGYSLTEAQFAAALSFHWNTGAIERASWVRHWKAGNTTKARRAFMDWNKPKEIISRRSSERDLFFDGRWSSKGMMTEYTAVTSNYTPKWSSAKRINIEKPLRAVFARTSEDRRIEPPTIDALPKPNALTHSQVKSEPNLIDILLSILRRLFIGD